MTDSLRTDTPVHPAAPAPWPRRAWGVLASLALSTAAVAAAAHYQRDPPPAPPEMVGLTVDKGTVRLTPNAPQWGVLKVGTATAPGPQWTNAVPARVKVDERLASKVGVPLAGRVSEVLVELGQKVKAGQALFSVSSGDIADLQAQQEKTQVDLDAARASLERVQDMVKANALPAKEELAAQQVYKQAEVAHRLAATKLDSLAVRNDGAHQFTVRSPRDGVVMEKNILVGQQVAPDAGAPLLVVAQMTSVLVVADLFEADASGVREGAVAEITSPSIPDLHIQGTVDMVSAVVDPEKHTVPIRVRVANAEHLLRPNVFASVRLATGVPPGSVEVAANALLSNGDKQYVYVQGADGAFSRREVVAGSVSGSRVLVLRGVNVGERVLEEGAILLDNQVALSD